MLQSLINNPKRPMVVIVGGAKISDKVDAVTNLTKIADTVLVGGGVANLFLKADAYNIARSYIQDTPADVSKNKTDYVQVAEKLIETTKQQKTLKDGYIPLPKIIYPIDVVAATSANSKKTRVINLADNGYTTKKGRNGDMFLDIGPLTVKLFSEIILSAGSIFWNGPMGVFEKEAFEKGTKDIARAVAKTSATTILGGGDTIRAINKLGLYDRYDYVSAAGGAALEFLSGKMLPGLKPLLKK